MSPAPQVCNILGSQNRPIIDENFDLVFGRLFGPFGLSLGVVLGASWGPFWDQVLLFWALGSLLDTLRLPKRRFHKIQTKPIEFN